MQMTILHLLYKMLTGLGDFFILILTKRDIKRLLSHSYYALFRVFDAEIYQFFSSCFFVFFVVHALIFHHEGHEGHEEVIRPSS